MLSATKPLVSEIESLDEIKTKLITFVLVASETNDNVNKIALSNKAFMKFFFIKSLEGQEEGSLNLIEDGKVAHSMPKGGDINKFIKKVAYPVVGNLTGENFKFFQERGLDMFWFGIKLTDTESIEAIKEGVKGYEGKYS